MNKMRIILVFLFFCFLSNYGFSQAWSQKADFGGTPRYVASGFSIGEKGYIGIGWDGSYRKDFWEYSPATELWTQKADFGGTPRYVATAFSILDKGYILGGYDGTGHKGDFWEYDTLANTWTEKAPFGGGIRSVAVGFSIGAKGYAGTGWNGEVKKDFWEYDPTLDIWSQKADFGGTARRYAVGFCIDSMGYIGTGNDSTIESTVKRDFWQYNPVTDTWVQKADFGGEARYVATGFAMGGKGYIGTGWDGVTFNTYLADFWEYNPDDDNWVRKENFGGSAREHSVAFSIGSDAGYLGTGWDGDDVTNDFWKYTLSLDSSVYLPDTTLIVDDSTLVIDDSTLVIDDSTLVIDDSTFVIDDSTLVIDDSTLVIDDSTLVIDDSTLVIDDSTLVIDDSTFIIQDGSFVVNDDLQAVDDSAQSTSVMGIDIKTQITVYPNPSDGGFGIKAEGGNLILVEMYNRQGQRVRKKHGRIGESLILIDASDVPKGLYQLTIITDLGVVNKKVIIQ